MPSLFLLSLIENFRVSRQELAAPERTLLWRQVGQSGDRWLVFMGEFRHTLDEKGRLFIPARFRDELGPSFVVTRGLDNCLFLFPPATWKLVEERLAALPVNRAASRAFTRMLFSGASECQPDRQGRVLVPPALRSYAGLDSDREAVVVGVSQRVEIWSATRWDAYTQQAASDFAQLAEEMVDMPL